MRRDPRRAPAPTSSRCRRRPRSPASPAFPTPARLELLGPAGRRVDVQPVGDDGRFALSATAGPAGRTEWTLRRHDAADAVVEAIPLPMEVVAAAPLRVLALSGGASPEQKYLA